jgi:tetratricopeptide (TPR) repeat protein
MKLVKGRTLQAVLNDLKKGDTATQKEYQLSALLTIFRKVCDAMAFAHSKGILHRDLKPENIMVGEYGEVLVMDWGLAKQIGTAEERTGNTVASQYADMGMTMEGEVIGTPLYMSPEQAEGMVTGLDERSDIYSLGGILYALLTLRAPIDGTTLNEVLTKVKGGQISSMASQHKGAKVELGTPAAMERKVPEALQAVTLKAMARKRDRRYASVEAFAADIEAYQNGFATQAEEAGAFKRVRLWVGRNRTLTASAAVVAVFAGKMFVDGQKAARALRELKESASVFAARAKDELQTGDFELAEKVARNAVRLDESNGEGHLILGDVLQVRERWEEALKAYVRAAELGSDAEDSVLLTERLVGKRKVGQEDAARVELYLALQEGGRQMESTGYARMLGEDFWKRHAREMASKSNRDDLEMSEAERMKRKDPSVIGELVKRLEAKLLPIPGTQTLMSKTEFTIIEWKLYLRAEGYPEWRQPDPNTFLQTDEHPVVNISWNEVTKFCQWLSKVTGKEWGLPTNAEWDAAVGKTQYPWGDYFPPHWDDGNYAILANGKNDPQKVGVDGIKGTAPVGSFKPNALGFYDLGGNACEWMADGKEKRNGSRGLRGGSWDDDGGNTRSGLRLGNRWGNASPFRGFRLVRR